MLIEANPKWTKDLDPSALASVARNNERIVNGENQILVNPAFEGSDDSELLKDVQQILSSYPLTDTLHKIEDSNALIFGPRSQTKNWVERKESLFAYFDHKDYDPEEFDSKSGDLRSTGIIRAADSLIKSTNSGLPYMKQKGLVLKEAVANYNSQVGVYPCVLFTRSAAGRKTRNVWGYPIADMLREMAFFKPWFAVERTYEWRAALQGPDVTDMAMSNLLMSKTETDLVIGVDFSAYDTSITPEYAYNAFNHIAGFFQSGDKAELYQVFRKFVTIPVYTPDGEVIGPHGVPSGSAFTNTIDSLVQYAASGAQYKCQIQGDDGVYIVPKGEQDLLVDRFKSLGFTINDDKSETFHSKEAMFLQRYYSETYPNRYGQGLGGVFSLVRALARIKYLEKWTNLEKVGLSGSDFFAIRTIIILENCKHHPGFEEFVKYVYKSDKYGLKFSDSSLIKYSKLEASRVKAGVYNGEIERQMFLFQNILVI